MIQTINQTYDQQFAMYMNEPKEKLVEMLIECNKQLHLLKPKIEVVEELKSIKVRISRCLCRADYIPYYLTVSSPKDIKVSKAWDKFNTLSDLKKFYKITKLKKGEKEWAISSRGKRYEWDSYEAEISTDYIINKQ